MAGNIFVLISHADNYGNGMLLRLLPFPWFKKSNAAIKKGIKENLDECSEAENIKYYLPEVILKKNPIHKQKWLAASSTAKIEYNQLLQGKIISRL
jgi:hypothetical protein